MEQKQDENKNESESDEEEEEDTDDLMESKNDEKTTIDLFKKIVDYLKPGETVLKAIKRLGSSSSKVSSSSSSSTSNLSASQRWLKKKQPQQTASSATIDSEKLKTDKQALETLTGYANQFIDQGFYDIYEETYEKIQLKLRNSAKQEADSFDIFADNLDENVLASSSGKSENITEGNLIFIYL